MDFKETREHLRGAKALYVLDWAEPSQDYEGATDLLSVSVLRDGDGNLWWSGDCNGGRSYARLVTEPTRSLLPVHRRDYPCAGDLRADQALCVECFGSPFDETTYVDGYV